MSRVIFIAGRRQKDSDRMLSPNNIIWDNLQVASKNFRFYEMLHVITHDEDYVVAGYKAYNDAL